MENLKNIEGALKSFLDKDEIISPLASVLEYGSNRDQVSYREIEKLLRGVSKETIKETLSWAAQWRLILPSWGKHFRSLSWGDRMIISTKPEIKYEVLRVTQCLVKRAAQTGLWNPEEAVKEVFKTITDIDTALALQIVRGIAKRVHKEFRVGTEEESPYYFISLDQLKGIFDEIGLTERKDSDLWVIELKATDIMSPAVNLMFSTWGEKSGFELNPSLFVKLE